MSTDAKRVAVPADGNEARFLDVYERCSRQIQAYCARRTPSSQVGDAVAEVFLVAWRRIDQIPDGDGTLPWLYGVAYRVLSHQWRQKARSRRLVERLRGLADLQEFTPELVVVMSEESRVVLDAANRLRSIDREILRLTLWEELTYEQVARVLGITSTAAKERAYRARRNLAAEYRKLSGDRRSKDTLRGGGE